MSTRVCPSCGRGDNLATLENVQGAARLAYVSASGITEYTGDTKMYWDSSQSFGWKCLDCDWEADQGLTDRVDLRKRHPHTFLDHTVLALVWTDEFVSPGLQLRDTGNPDLDGRHVDLNDVTVEDGVVTYTVYLCPDDGTDDTITVRHDQLEVRPA